MMSQLTQHPGVVWDMNNYEPLNQFDYEELNPWGAAQWAREYFERWNNPVNNPEGKLPGFKMSSVTIVKAPEVFRQLARDFKLRILWNFREDALKRAAGRYPYYYLKDNTSIGGLNLGEGAASRCDMGVGCSFKIERMGHLHCVMIRNAKVDEYMKKAVDILTADHGCYLELLYEDYLQYPDEQMGEIYKFLGLENLEVESKRGKATSDNMCKVIENYEEVCAAFNECSAWKKWLNDPKNGCSCEDYTYTSLGGDGVNELCSTQKPPDYARWCGGVNYEEDVQRILRLREEGPQAMKDFKEAKLGSSNEAHREPTVIHLNKGEVTNWGNPE
mmetsp:Transcript_41204/g.162581  ORF Transcript_41204/g.162581 Transcript_41204/m.162581 type:complete len:331 (-) Transcript_41204:1840-2832(-)